MNFKVLFRRYDRLGILTVTVLLVAAITVGMHLHQQHKQTYSLRRACDILTPAVARRVGGAGLQAVRLKSTSDASTVTTFCVYRGATRSVALVVRAPKNKAGAELNHKAFSAPPVSSHIVRGYGDDAYWTPTLAQLNIRKHDTWYLLSSGSNTTSQRTLAQTQKLANIINDRL